MDIRLKCETPQEIVYTITATATAGEWERFRDALDEASMKSLLPLTEVHAFRHRITDVLAQARKIYWPATTS